MPQESKRFEMMRTAARTIQDTPLAPYEGLMRGMSRQDIDTVLMFLHEVRQEMSKEENIVDIIRAKYNIPESEHVKWLREHATATPEWDPQSAWDKLTDAQREQAERLKLSPSDMDVRTFGLLTKWVKE